MKPANFLTVWRFSVDNAGTEGFVPDFPMQLTFS